jgi:nitrogen regulatory protein PII 2
VKEVIAIIRMNMMNKTKRALADAGVSSMYAKECLGRGKGTVELPRYLGGAEATYETMIQELGVVGRLIPKRMIHMIVPDKLVKTVVNTVIGVNKTGRSGDGKIFVIPLSESWRIRTGESGDAVLDQ